jgi:hypothetical protein
VKGNTEKAKEKRDRIKESDEEKRKIKNNKE